MSASHSVIVKSQHSNIHGDYTSKGSHNGKPAYVRDEAEGAAGKDEMRIFHESRWGHGESWYFGPSYQEKDYLLRSSSDGPTPDKASWRWVQKAGGVECITDASTTEMVHAKDAGGLFQDPEFPHNKASIGMRGHRNATWVPARFLRRGKWKLFDGITPTDLLQGGVGNCWFVAALACMAEYPKEVQDIFVDAKDIKSGGKYTLRLFDFKQNRLRDITVDEFIPCHPTRWHAGGKPLFAKPNGNEAWVLLLEKAFAKMAGSYAVLNGGHMAVAYRALTGEKKQIRWDKEKGGTWRKSYLQDGSAGFSADRSGQKVSSAELRQKMLKYEKLNFMMSAAMLKTKSREKKRKDGLVEGHAYSILSVRDEEGQTLVKMRNPWGRGREWNGAWSDGDAMWKAHPKVKAALHPEEKKDGIFWMSFEDFTARFDHIEVCCKSMRSGGAGAPICRAVPFASTRLPARPTTPLNCPGKHGLSKQTIIGSCDLCRRRLGPDCGDMFGCRVCDYDVCDRCVKHSPGLEKVDATALPLPPRGYPTDPSPPVAPAAAATTPHTCTICARESDGKHSTCCWTCSDTGGKAHGPTCDALNGGTGTHPEKPKFSCPGDHDLTLLSTNIKGITCDLCDVTIKYGVPAWSCRPCDFDACLTCASSNIGGKLRSELADLKDSVELIPAIKEKVDEVDEDLQAATRGRVMVASAAECAHGLKGLYYSLNQGEWFACTVIGHDLEGGVRVKFDETGAERTISKSELAARNRLNLDCGVVKAADVSVASGIEELLGSIRDVDEQ